MTVSKILYSDFSIAVKQTLIKLSTLPEISFGCLPILPVSSLKVVRALTPWLKPPLDFEAFSIEPAKPKGKSCTDLWGIEIRSTDSFTIGYNLHVV